MIRKIVKNENKGADWNFILLKLLPKLKLRWNFNKSYVLSDFIIFSSSTQTFYFKTQSWNQLGNEFLSFYLLIHEASKFVNIIREISQLTIKYVRRKQKNILETFYYLMQLPIFSFFKYLFKNFHKSPLNLL